MREIKFKGVISGDGESFCFDIDRETFIRITGREPVDCDDFQSGTYEYVEEGIDLVFVPQDADKCRLYPNELFGGSADKVEVEIKVKLL